MVEFRSLYRHAEEHIVLLTFGLFVLLGALLILQSLFSSFFVLSILLVIGFVILSFCRPLWTLAFVAIYLPFESVFLKFVPEDIYVFARYFSEGLIYLLCLVVLWNVLAGKIKLRHSPIDFPFILFVVILFSSALINVVEPTIAVLGIRQIIRFILVFFLVAYLRPSKTFIKRLTAAMFAIVLCESVIGITQSFVGESMDTFLLPSDMRSLGDITLTSGVSQFWDPGSRVFATLGRYDRLGNFLYFFLLLATGFLYEARSWLDRRQLWLLFALGLPTLLLTYSRSSWFAFLFGFLFISLWIKRDRRVAVTFAAFLIVIASYLTLTGLQVRFITEAPGQTLTERFYETFSYARWRGEYIGLGRVFWFVQTITTVVPASPLFGFGPGQYGGGAVAALENGLVYERLGLPYGVFGTEGMIDNNWFSLWGESGTLGIIFYGWMYVGLFVYALHVYRRSKDPTVRALAMGMAAVLIGVGFNAFTSTVLEIRTLAFYLWMYAGFLYVLDQKRPRQRHDRLKEEV
ncbi:MAG: O-antigen ligase family protein [Patescibacteria group bacterium]